MYRVRTQSHRRDIGRILCGGDNYGRPQIWRGHLVDGVRVGKARVQKLMQLQGIFGKGKRRFKVTTDSVHDFLT